LELVRKKKLELVSHKQKKENWNLRKMAVLMDLSLVRLPIY